GALGADGRPDRGDERGGGRQDPARGVGGDRAQPRRGRAARRRRGPRVGGRRSRCRAAIRGDSRSPVVSILVGPDTRLVVQGITGREGEFHARAMLEYGTPIVAGVTPGKGGLRALDDRVPVFKTVAEAVEETGANTSCVFVPAAGAP